MHFEPLWLLGGNLITMDWWARTLMKADMKQASRCTPVFVLQEPKISTSSKNHRIIESIWNLVKLCETKQSTNSHLFATRDLPQCRQRCTELHGVGQLGALGVALHGLHVLVDFGGNRGVLGGANGERQDMREHSDPNRRLFGVHQVLNSNATSFANPLDKRSPKISLFCAKLL